MKNSALETSPVISAAIESAMIAAVELYTQKSIWTKETDEGTSLFSTDFPTYEEFLFLLYTKIRTIYFFGDVTDDRVVKLLNDYKKNRPLGDPDFKIVNLKN